jgi:hypothetical protein
MMCLPGEGGRYDLHRIAVLLNVCIPVIHESDLVHMRDGTGIVSPR